VAVVSVVVVGVVVDSTAVSSALSASLCHWPSSSPWRSHRYSARLVAVPATTAVMRAPAREGRVPARRMPTVSAALLDKAGATGARVVSDQFIRPRWNALVVVE
jgi:hypothetical protein